MVYFKKYKDAVAYAKRQGSGVIRYSAQRDMYYVSCL